MMVLDSAALNFRCLEDRAPFNRLPDEMVAKQFSYTTKKTLLTGAITDFFVLFTDSKFVWQIIALL